jgi:hypothetical protein
LSNSFFVNWNIKSAAACIDLFSPFRAARYRFVYLHPAFHAGLLKFNPFRINIIAKFIPLPRMDIISKTVNEVQG